jgi:hypothetical protein
MLLKKIFLNSFPFLLFIILCFDSIGQGEIEKNKNFRISFFHAYAYQTNFIPKELRNIAGLSYNTIGPIGIKFQYLFNNRNESSEKFKGSLGFNLNFRESQLRAENDVFVEDITNSFDGPIKTDYNFIKGESRNSKIITFLASYNFHYLSPNSKFELISSISVGYNNGSYTRKIDGVEVSLEKLTLQYQENDTVFRQGFFPYKATPFGFRISQAFRYYPLKNIGIELEIGLGNYIISGGLVFRF